jgi:hypothetical protein
MPNELYANLATTTIVSGANTTPSAGTSESWVVTSSTGFPAASNAATPPTQFRAVVHDDVATPTTREIVIVTNVSGTTWSVTRGAEGSTISAHPAGHRVTMVFTAASILKEVPKICYIVAASGAPQPIKDAAHYVCDGVSDEVEINLAITAASAAAIAGTGAAAVQLTAGDFNIGNSNTGPVKMRRRVELRGADRESTFLFGQGTWAGHDAVVAQGGIVEPFDTTQDRWKVTNLTIAGGGAGHDSRGIYANISSNTGFLYGTETHIVIQNVYIRTTKRTGMDMRGFYSRMNTIINVHIYDLGTATIAADGMYWDALDSELFAVHVGAIQGSGSVGNAIVVSGSNNRFTACKGFYADLSGWLVSGVRNELTACEGQDNLMHGFDITGQWNTLASCSADSNSYDGSPSGGITGRTYHGFRVNAHYTTLAACMAIDKNEAARGVRQVYGYYIESGIHSCQVIGIAENNFTGQVGGPGVDGAYNNIQVTGQQGAVDANFIRFVGSAMGTEITFWRSEATTAVTNQGALLPVALTELDNAVLGARKIVESVDIGSQVQIAVTMRVMQATADSVVVSIRDTSNTANILATITITVPAAVNTLVVKSVYAARPAWLTGDKTLAIYTSHTGAATLNYIFKDITLRQRP